jgi:hypothetical protein
MTLVTEAVEKKLLKAAGGLMLKEAQAILETVAQRAKDGDMTAAKLILDRIIPIQRAREDLVSGTTSIQINIVGSEIDGNQESSRTISAQQSKPNWKINSEALSGEIEPEYADADG